MLLRWMVIYLCVQIIISCKEGEEKAPVGQVVLQNVEEETHFDSLQYQWDGDYVLVNWQDLLEVTFQRTPHALLDSADIPQFTEKVKALNGRKVIVEGFYIPVEETGDEKIVILSAFPYVQCFFCGQAGVESIIDVLIKEKLPPIKTDTKVRFQGTFKTNADNFDYLIYILEDAKYLPSGK